MPGFVTCPRCGGKAFRNAKGKLLAHTTPAKGGTRLMSPGFGFPPMPVPTGAYVEAEVCE
jgi:hypothetical protein